MPKHTRLDEHASIYQPREEQNEKEKLKDMSLRDKFSYLLEYYKLPGAVTLAAILIIIYIIYSVITPNINPRFYAAVINSTIPSDTVEEYGNSFASYLQLDPKTETVVMNDALSVSYGSDYASNIQQMIATYVAAKEIDVIIAPETEFNNLAYTGYFAKLSDELPTDVYSSLTDSFFITSSEEEPEKNAYGIYLNNSDLFKDATFNSEQYVLGIVVNYPHKDNTVEFIKYLFKNSKNK